MASTHIEINGSATRLNIVLRHNIEQMRHIRDDMAWCKGILDTVSAGSDWAALGTALGLSATDAQTVYNLLVLAAARVQSAPVDDFVNKLG